jgi:hypothetical protein
MMFDHVDKLVKSQNPELFRLAERNIDAARKFQTILLYIHRCTKGRPKMATISKPIMSSHPGVDAAFQLGVRK